MKEPNNQEGEREKEAKESLGQKGSGSFLAHFLPCSLSPMPTFPLLDVPESSNRVIGVVHIPL